MKVISDGLSVTQAESASKNATTATTAGLAGLLDEFRKNAGALTTYVAGRKPSLDQEDLERTRFLKLQAMDDLEKQALKLAKSSDPRDREQAEVLARLLTNVLVTDKGGDSEEILRILARSKSEDKVQSFRRIVEHREAMAYFLKNGVTDKALSAIANLELQNTTPSDINMRLIRLINSCTEVAK